MLKQDYVSQWWAERVASGTQLSEAKRYRDKGYLVEAASSSRWFSRIDTDALWEDFSLWMGDRINEPGWSGTIKAGFMLMFYKASGATRARTRKSRGKSMRYVAVFRPIDDTRIFPDT